MSPLRRRILLSSLFTLFIVLGATGCGGDECKPGQKGCECFPNATCGQDGDGNWLVCSEGKCVEPLCDVGSEDCGCFPNFTCYEGLRCKTSYEGHRCVPSGCEPGSAGCACHEDGSCDDDGYSCMLGVCVPEGCLVGSQDCACRIGGECDEGLACHGGVCVGVTNTVPENVKCYTPCKEDLVLPDGTVRRCSDEGLMEGCVGGLECIQGSCVPVNHKSRNFKDASGADDGTDAGDSTEAGAPEIPTCQDDTECPDFQKCIDGHCYSNCETNDDCKDKEVCYRHVCRLSCSVDADECPDGYYCEAKEGTEGACMPVTSSDGTNVPISGSFELTEDNLHFTSSKTQAYIILTNNAPMGLEFTIKKIKHTYTDPDLGYVSVTTNPLSWMEIGEWGHATRAQESKVFVEGNGGTKKIVFMKAGDTDLTSWTGVVEIVHPQLGKKKIYLTYTEVPEGKWIGEVYYFSNFSDRGLDDWLAVKDTDDVQEYLDKLKQVGNAFVQKWGMFRRGWLDPAEFMSVISATVEGSWAFPSVKKICPWPDGACVLYDNPLGYIEYTDDVVAHPIPTGVTKLPFAVAMHVDPAAGDARVYSGRVMSEDSLQYLGNPAMRLTFQLDPASSECSAMAMGVCLTYLEGFTFDAYLGGRYILYDGSGACDPGYEVVKEPWLIEGFTMGTGLQEGERYKFQCATTSVPFGEDEERNIFLARANPIPSGTVMHRKVSLVDGILIDRQTLVILFRETMDAFVPSDDKGFVSYGLMVLRRRPANLTDDDYKGESPSTDEAPSHEEELVTCDPDVVRKITGESSVTQDNVSGLIRGLLFGDRMSADNAVTVQPVSFEEDGDDSVSGRYQIHYWCEANGLIDGGRNPATREECPWGSSVRFFIVDTRPDGEHLDTSCLGPSIRDNDCQDNGSCLDTILAWERNGFCNIIVDPAWKCTGDNPLYCDDDRSDPRQEKIFYVPNGEEPAFIPLRMAIANAFRYRIQFQSSTGGELGFTPSICVPDSDAVPYCYDPEEIEEIEKRVDCLMYINRYYYDSLNPDDRELIHDFLVYDFSRDDENDREGFERLYAELLVMLGDDAYTEAFASRFDLAGMNARLFEGDLFEPNGVRLSGGAGYELYTLYKAVQYYQMALDRFYKLADHLWAALSSPERNFITQETVVTYFSRLTKASTHKARAYAEIARRYSKIERADLARSVIERAYAAIYMEAIVLSRLELKVVSVVDPNTRDQIRQVMEETARIYSTALQDMRETYAKVGQELNYFGFSPDYIPFPALTDEDVNAFEKLIEMAEEKLNIAKEKEQYALSSISDAKKTEAEFQAELAKIRQTYENQLAEICGTFRGDDGNIYPAIPKYAYLSKTTSVLANPCGLTGTGQIADLYGDLKQATLDLKLAISNYDAQKNKIKIEQERISQYCHAVVSFADFMFMREEHESNLEDAIGTWEEVKEDAEWALEVASEEVDAVDCITIVGLASGTNCIQKGIMYGIWQAVKYASMAAIVTAKVKINQLENELDEYRRQTAYYKRVQECQYVKINGLARVSSMVEDLLSLTLEIQKAHYKILQVKAQIETLYHQAERLIAQEQETEKLAINAAAAVMDPNVRIYRNDAVLAADRTFQEALAAAYKATKVYEYFTSQSYAGLNELYLVRMVSHGDYNLEEYLSKLRAAYNDFLEQYGYPDVRVAVLSLKNDILDVPRLSPNYTPYTEEQRVKMFREILKGTTYLDSHGYLVFPFNTTLSRLSPLTRNHKILYVEAEIIGSDTGDNVGRIYLRQKGTGVIRSLNEGMKYYAFPERTAVVNTFFNGKRFWVFSDEDVFRNWRLRDRPLVNTRWELVFNQVDEWVNKDINIDSINDIKVYIYYTDFTI